MHSVPGAGSCFSVRLSLPLAAPDGPPAAEAPARLPGPVLLAEPHATNQAALLRLVQHLGAATAQAVGDLPAVWPALQAAQAAGTPMALLLLRADLPGCHHLLARLAAAPPPGLQVGLLATGAAQPAPAGAWPQLDLPVMPAALLQLAHQAAWPLQPEPTDAALLAGLRVLLVEDHPMNRELVLTLLGEHGAQVRCADNGLEALERLHAEGPEAYDLVLMDLQMPVMDGYEAVRRLRQMPSFNSLPVLALTAHASTSDRDRCLALGMQGHLGKPVDVQALLAAVRACWRPSQASQAGPAAPASLVAAAAAGAAGSPEPTTTQGP